MRSLGAGLLVLGLLAGAGSAMGDMTPAPPRSRMPPAPSAEHEYSRGLAATRAREWSVAAAAFSRAIEMKPAYDEALRLRPDYPEALEYLGETYVKMGRGDDARRVLERLKPLDAAMARELAEAIAKGK